MRCWLVVDDSGSMTHYDEVTRRLFEAIRRDLENDLEVRAFKTGSALRGLAPYSGSHLGNSGGDGFQHIGHYIRTSIPGREAPEFVIYLTDSEANFEAHRADLDAHKILMVDVTAPWITGPRSGMLDEKAETITEALMHHGDCPDYGCDEGDEECDYAFCGVNVFQTQPFYPRWDQRNADMQAMTDRFMVRAQASMSAWSTGYSKSIKSLLDEIGPGDVIFFDELAKVARPYDVVGPHMLAFKHPVDKDLDEINRTLDAHKDAGVQRRALIGVEINDKIMKIVGGNSLTPEQQLRIKATRYRLYTECLNMDHEHAHRAAFVTDTLVKTLNPEAPGGPTMSARINTTVSLTVTDRNRATVLDLKTLIAEVERVGGTDDSYIDLQSAYSRGTVDAVVVTAVEVTQPELDPSVACALTIEDTAAKVNTLIDLSRDGTRTVREQARKALTDLATPKPAAKTTAKKAAAKPAAKN